MGDVHCSEWYQIHDRAPPPKSGVRRLHKRTPGGRWSGGGTGGGDGGPGHVGPMRPEPTRAGRTRQQGREGTLGRPLWREVTLAGHGGVRLTLAGQRRREVTHWQVSGGRVR